MSFDRAAWQRAYRQRPERRARDRVLSAQYHAAYAAADPEGWRAARTANTRQWKQRHQAACVQARRKERQRSLESCILSRIKSRAKREGIPFDLVLADIVVPERCPALGILLTPFAGQHLASSPSVDRLIPALGYVRGNIAIISCQANRIKQDATAADIRKVADWLDKALPVPIVSL